VYHPDVLVSVLRPAFVAASVAWALLLPLVPLIASRPHATPIGTALLIGVYAIGSAICHQLPERSYHLWTAQMPVCARCAGIYGGAAAAAILSLAPAGQRCAYSNTVRVRPVLFIAALPTLVTLVYEWTTGHMPANWIRTVTGVPLGATVAWMVLSSMPHLTRAENQVN
jgi:uncharacterized membrane protein